MGLEWRIFDLAKPRCDKKLPVVLSRDEVWQILDEVTIPVYRVCLTTIYSCGLWLLEGATLQVPQIDSARMQLHIHGKGGRDRFVPLPEGTLEMLRCFWRTHRAPVLLFPSISRKGLKHCENADEVPIHRSNLQGAFRWARDKAGFVKVRYYGLWASACRDKLEKARRILNDHHTAVGKKPPRVAPPEPAPRPTPRCPKCGSPCQDPPVAIPRPRGPP